MLLAIDIGNTNIVFALHNNSNWIHHWREKSDAGTMAETYAFNLSNQFLENDISVNQVTKIVISSVVPGLLPVVEKMADIVFNLSPLVVGPEVYDHLAITTNNPKEIGTDLVANAVAAYHRFKGDCLVIDFGTALTFTTVDKHGIIAGVAIAPGIKTAMKSLSGNTAQLPEIPLELPDSVMGKNTIHAMQAGILHGYVGLVKHMIDKIKYEIDNPVSIIATGGLSSVLTPLHDNFDALDPLLTLEGLRVIAEELSIT